MRIVFVDTTMDGPLVGGAHTFLVQLMTKLDASGHEIHFVSKGVPIAKSAAKISESNAVIHSDLWNGMSLVEDAAPKFAKWVNDLAPDVYVVSVSPDIGWAVLPLLDPQFATLCIGHNDQETFYSPVRHYHKFLTRAVGVSDEICEMYVKSCGIDPGRVEWIPYGVEANENAPADNGPGPVKLIYVGRLDEHQKRISDVVKITKLLSQSGIDFVFDIVGDGDEMRLVKRELADETASGKVRLHGWLEAAQVIAAMRSADVFILASAYEGFCIALTEAMANGCTPVVTDIKSGNKQLVADRVNGFVVPIGDIDAFVGKIEVLTANRTKLLEFRRAAWETGRQYSVERMVDNYDACFERAIEDTRRNPRTPDPAFPLMESCRSRYPLWLRRIKAKAKGILAAN